MAKQSLWVHQVCCCDDSRDVLQSHTLVRDSVWLLNHVNGDRPQISSMLHAVSRELGSFWGRVMGGDRKNTLARSRSCTLIVPGVDALPRSAPRRRAPERLILVAMGFFFTSARNQSLFICAQKLPSCTNGPRGHYKEFVAKLGLLRVGMLIISSRSLLHSNFGHTGVTHKARPPMRVERA